MSQFLGTIFQHGSAPVAEATMKFAEARHRLVLSNVANADTPGYRRLDLDDKRFNRSLERAIEDRGRRGGPLSFIDRNREPIRTRFGVVPGPSVARMPYEGPLRHDDNSVSLEREMAILAMNGGKFRSMAGFVRKEYAQLKDAIAERSTS